MISQCTDRLGQMISGDVDLRQMSAADQTFHREVFSVEVRNQKLRQIYTRVAGLSHCQSLADQRYIRLGQFDGMNYREIGAPSYMDRALSKS